VPNNQPLATITVLNYLEWTEGVFHALEKYLAAFPVKDAVIYRDMCAVAGEETKRLRNICEECVVVPLTDVLR
jgi:hypothetical protein